LFSTFLVIMAGLMKVGNLTDNGDVLVAKSAAFATAVITVASFIAVYALALFGHAHWGELQKIAPFSKFISIKALLFFTGFQEFFCTFYAVKLAPHTDASQNFIGFPAMRFGGLDNERSVGGLLNTLLIVEMFLLAIAHDYVYLPEDLSVPRLYTPSLASDIQIGGGSIDAMILKSGSTKTESFGGKLKAVLNFGDILHFYGSLAENAQTQSTKFYAEGATRGQRGTRLIKYLFCHILGCSSMTFCQKRCKCCLLPSDELDESSAPLIQRMSSQ